MTTAQDPSLDPIKTSRTGRAPVAWRDHHALKIGAGLVGVILVAGVTELAWPGDDLLVVLRTALFLFAGGVAVWLLSREIARLREAEARYSLVVAAADAGIWDWDVLTDEMFLSERARHLYGLQPSATVRRHTELRELVAFHPDDLDAERIALRDFLAGPATTYDGEWRVRHADGVYRWVRIRAFCVRDATGRAMRMAGSVSDIDAKTRAQAALRFSEQRAALAMEASGDGHWDWNVPTDEFYGSPRMLEMYGVPRGTTFATRSDFVAQVPFHPEDRRKWEEAIAAHFAGKTARFDIEIRMIPRGETRWIHQTGLLSRDTSGKPLRWTGAVADVTERKLAEEALRESEARFRTLAELSADWYWKQDENLRFTHSWSEFQELAGFPNDAWLGKTRWELPGIKLLSGTWREHQALLEARQPFRDFEYCRIGPAGIARYMSISGAPILDEQGHFKGYEGIGREITERKKMEEELRESEARFRSLTKLSSDWYWRQDVNLRFTHIWSEVGNHGYTADSSIGKTRWELAGIIKLLDGTWAEHKAVLEARQPFRDLEYCRIGPDGVVRFISISGVPVFDGEGRFKGYEGVGLNITERKQVEQELRARQEILDAAQKAARAVAFEWRIGTGEGQNRWSPDLEAMYGLAPGSYDGTYDSWRKLVFPEDFPVVNAAIERAAETGDLAAEYRVVHPDGSVHWLQAKGRMFFDAGGEPTRVVGFMLDVSERHQAEIDETRFRSFFDLPLIGMGVTSPERRFLDVNEKLCQILGYARAELIGRDWASITHPDDVGGNLVLLDKAFNGETDSYSMEKRYIHRDGHIVYAAISVCCVRRPDGTADHFVLTVQDLTVRQQAEEELRRLEQQLRQAQRLEAMGTLAGGIAHDFNNILGAILGYGEMALRGASKGSRLRRDLDSIMTAGERGRALVERILAFSRSGVGERVAVHVERVVREALDQLAANLPANVTIFPRLRAGRAAVLGDPTQVHQVFMNLATNAIQAMPSGGTLRMSLDGVRLDAPRVATVGTLEAGDYVVLEVADSGVGIAPETLGRIFDPFFTTKEVGVGTGLGLSLVHGIVTELGGAIDVTSTVGAGSVFTVYLPRAGDADDDREREAPEAPRGNREQVLIVDDEAPLVQLATETLAELGYVPVGFTSSAAALEAFRAEPQRFDAVVTDERMPGMSGSALIREIRGIRRAIPILLVSGYVGGQVVRRALESGADEVLKKPLSARELATSLARVLHA
jgi:PAS domain S-box-containing protein